MKPGRSAAKVIVSRFQLGLTCNLLGDIACAKDGLKRYLELAPDGPDAETAQSLLDYLE